MPYSALKRAGSVERDPALFGRRNPCLWCLRVLRLQALRSGAAIVQPYRNHNREILYRNSVCKVSSGTVKPTSSSMAVGYTKSTPSVSPIWLYRYTDLAAAGEEQPGLFHRLKSTHHSVTDSETWSGSPRTSMFKFVCQ